MTLTLELPPDLEAQLSEEAARRGMTLSEYALERLRNVEDGERTESDEGRSLLELARQVHAQIPPDERAHGRSDGARHYRHYLYGHPKAEE